MNPRSRPLYFEKPYYLEPDKGAGEAYASAARSARQIRKVGVAHSSCCATAKSLVRAESPGNAPLNTLRFASNPLC
jgi:non-homologous end joining protein Ku